MPINRYLSLLVFCLPFWASAMAPSTPRRVDVLLVPAEPDMVRVGLDLHVRKSVVLMSYATESEPEAPFLHVWDGAAWVRVPASRFAEGTFLKSQPTRVLVVGEDRPLTTSLIEQAAGWAPEVLNLAPASVTDLINRLGRQFDFKRADWEWFAAGYELELEDLNQNVRPASWYDSHRASELPPAEKPWRRTLEEPAAVPSTSLEPIPMTDEEDAASLNGVEVEDVPAEDAVGMEEEVEPEAFSFEVE